MLLLTEIKLPLDHLENELEAAVIKRLGIQAEDLLGYSIFKRSYDARKRNAIKLVYTLNVEIKREEDILRRKRKDARVRPSPDTSYKYVAKAPSHLTTRPLVIGTGPCGMFTGLILAQMGYDPILIERGKIVRERTIDTFEFWRGRQLNPESNVQFGEGGAGTFSDGKLHTQTKDREHRGRKVLTEYVEAGAPEEILYISKPHIGTLKLVKIIENMRKKIESLGGEFRFQNRLDDLLIEDGQVSGVILSSGEQIKSDHVVLAIGHSARDTFQMLFERGVAIEPKHFSIGLRIEHPQSLIDQCQLGENAGHPILGAADNKLVHHCSNGRSVYSFCMCPGGTVLAAASEYGTVVTNGMSQYSRSALNANSALVVEVTPRDYPGSPLAGIDFQRLWEQRAFELGGSTNDAPAQLVGDFLADRPSTTPGSVQPSYKPGVLLGDLSSSLPVYVIEAIREALPAFDKRLKGFVMDDAVLTGVETRTSSPIRIKRKEDYQSVSIKGIYPAGEGSGYAGGILSSAVDGIKVAEAVALNFGHAIR
ncbi:MAG: NAD(P)/FAD-dependent oxidoreductase [Anaerolineaceae bacterium]|nr:NAD(P)/FAD-dependent oxidoreductase [Anaerolineaceae bacterium]